MANKTKTNKTAATISEVATNAGLLLMTAAATVGMLELPNHPNNKIAVPNQPAFAFANPTAEQEAKGNQIRKEKEETGPHYVSYSVTQRTPGRTGKF